MSNKNHSQVRYTRSIRKMQGRADLGEEDGGIYDWIGRANREKFVGFYTSQKYTGTFEMGRPKEASRTTSENSTR